MDQLEHNIAFHAVQVELIIGLPIVFLEENYRVLAPSHLQIFVDSLAVSVAEAAPQRVGLISSGLPTTAHGIDVDGNKEVGLLHISEGRAPGERYKDVGRAGIIDFHIGALAFNQSTEGQRILQRQVFLLGNGTGGTRVMAAMPGI